MTIINQEALEERANNLGTFNGIEMVLVDLVPQANPTQAILEAHFFNSNKVTAMFNAIDANASVAKNIFPITGGHRILGGAGTNEVKVIDAEKVAGVNTALRLTVEPIGDYSTYTLSVNFEKIDPFLGEVDFRFRPGCFNYCKPEGPLPGASKQEPPIDYLAKDYESFRHMLMSWMSQKVPNWQPTSEADLDQVLIELFSAAADELSDYQDRMVNEAYFLRARKRVSLARHARLMDYHIHQGNQASTWLALRVNALGTLSEDFEAGTGEDIETEEAIVFTTLEDQAIDPLLDEIGLYTWSDAEPALAAGATEADLKLKTAGQAAAETVRDLIRDGKVSYLIIQEHRNPLTGKERGRDPTKRQLLRLLPNGEGAEALQDPVTGEWFVRVRWLERDALQQGYCFTVECPDKVENVSMFHGNLVKAYQGRKIEVTFKEKPTNPDVLLASEGLYYKRSEKQGAICRLPRGPLAYRDTETGGDIPPKSSLVVVVDVGGQKNPWNEVISLIHSDEQADDFIVETDELGRSLIRFGNGVNGRELPKDAEVTCSYQIAYGPDGNIGADALQAFDVSAFPEVDAIWNPFDVTNGFAPEPVDEIVRRAPQAYRYNQLRAITLQDYVERAVEVEGVSRATARYMWTGSWRTVRVTIDPLGTTELTDDLRNGVYTHLEAVRLLGEDLEIRPPEFVPLDITVWLCIHSDYWTQDIKALLEEEFSDGYTRDGRLGFFHPDRWTFGQPLRASEILGRAQSVRGVDHVIKARMKRWHQVGDGDVEIINVRPNEIIQVKNNPDHMEKGFIKFEIEGGRQ